MRPRASGAAGRNCRLTRGSSPLFPVPIEPNPRRPGGGRAAIRHRRGENNAREGCSGPLDIDTGGRRLKEVHCSQVEEESGAISQFQCMQQRRQAPPSLPPAPPNLTTQQLKRRYIVAAIVHSENSYVTSLQRLVNVRARPRSAYRRTFFATRRRGRLIGDRLRGRLELH